MTEAVVDVLEVVHVQKQRRDRDILASGSRQHLLGSVQDQCPVGQAGEEVVECLMTKFARLLLNKRQGLCQPVAVLDCSGHIHRRRDLGDRHTILLAQGCQRDEHRHCLSASGASFELTGPGPTTSGLCVRVLQAR